MHHRLLVVVIWSGVPQELRGCKWEKLIFELVSPGRKCSDLGVEVPGVIVGRQKNKLSENPWLVAVWKSVSSSASRLLFKAKTYSHYSLVLSFYQGSTSFRKRAGNVWANSGSQILPWVKAYIKTMPSKRFPAPQHLWWAKPTSILPPFQNLYILDCWYFVHHFPSFSESFFSSFSNVFCVLTVLTSTSNFPGLLVSTFL